LNKNRIKVVGGIIINKNKILVAQRSIQKEHPLKWEFPGGKIKVNENPIDALKREIKEELSVDVKKYKFLLDYEYDYQDIKKIHLYFYKIDEYIGKVRNIEHNQLLWIQYNDLEKLDFLDGDRMIIDHIQNLNILR
jgi:8-oxo-dGTP diphosphatase|tara:strand:- start:2629 stop:3036 length:408 start_codon:yes stop_codon:yes gene_type:complete